MHQALRRFDLRKAKRRIDAVRVLSTEQPTAETLEFWMSLQSAHQFARDALPLMRWEDDDVAEPGKRGAVADNTSEPDERALIIAGDSADGILRGAFDSFARDIRRPIGFAQQRVNRFNVGLRRPFNCDVRQGDVP